MVPTSVIIGDATLICGDCFEVLPLLKGPFEAVIADPWYAAGDAYADEMRRLVEMLDPLVDWRNERGVGGGVCAFYQWMFNANDWTRWFPTNPGYRLFANIDPFTPRPLNDRPHDTFDPLVVWGSRPSETDANHALQTVDERRALGQVGHPGARPIQNAAQIIRCLTNPGDTILDPYMGSGTLGIAALQTGRKYVGIEIEQTYADIAARRIKETHDGIL